MAKTNYAGIDYGMGESNVDRETGVRFGVISQHAVRSWIVYEEFEPQYTPYCGHCGNQLDRDKIEDGEIKCGCGETSSEDDIWPDEADYYWYDDGRIQAKLCSDGDIFVLKSPYVGRFQFCSPCAPGAVHLENPCDTGAVGYCLPDDWFEDGKAPYEYERHTEELVGDNYGIVRQKLGRIHALSSILVAARAARPKRMRTMPVSLRRGWVKCVIETMREYRDTFNAVMGGK